MDADSPIFRKIMSRVLGDKPQPGDKIPTESELMNEFGLTRYTVRQALTLLVQMGIIERTPRNGSRIKAIESDALTSSMRIQFELADFDEAEFSEARLMIECSMIPYVSRRLSPKDRSDLRTIIEGIRRNASEPMKADELACNFHLALLKICGNRVMGVFAGVLQTYFSRTRHCLEGQPPAYFESVSGLFEKLLKHLEQGDVESATDDMRSIVLGLPREPVLRGEREAAAVKVVAETMN